MLIEYVCEGVGGCGTCERRGVEGERGGEKERREGGKRVGWVGEVDERMSG